MPSDKDNIPRLSRPAQPGLQLQRQIRAVLFAMLILTGFITATAFFIAGSPAMLAAFAGGLSQIAAVLVYARISRFTGIPAPKILLSRFMLAELAKIVVSLMLLLAGYLLFGEYALWFAAAFVVALAAYLLVLLLK